MTDEHDNTTRIDRVPPHETAQSPMSVSVAMPRYFGLTPPTLLFAVATAAVALALVLAALSHWASALVLAVVGLALLAVFVGSARRKPDSALARSSVRTLDIVHDRANWLFESLNVRSAAAGSVRRLRAELVLIGEHRDRRLRALGEAVYRGDTAAKKSLTAELRRLEAAAKEKEEQMHAIAESARERLDRGRLSVQPTLIGPPGPVPVPEPGPPPDEGTPPTPPPIPEPYPPPDEGTLPQPDPAPPQED